MIDTVALTLKPDHFAILDHARFTPSTAGLFKEPYYLIGKRGYIKCVQNPSREELQNGIYKPRLTVTRRMGTMTYATTLRIEFSAPKLLFGNNFDEVTEQDFKVIVDRLKLCLQEMGVLVVRPLLENAPISAIHYSKNIPLTDHSTPSAILNELVKADMNQKLDLNQTDFRNGGHSLKFRANAFEVVLYDKIKDMDRARTSEKRSIERDYAGQLDLFEIMKPKKPFEVLRFEIRLGNRAKIRAVLKKLRLPSDMTFKGLFVEKTSKGILQTYLAEIVGGYSVLPPRLDCWRNFIWSFRVEYPALKTRKMLQIAGMTAICQELGVPGFREAIGSYGPHHWPRLKKDLLSYAPSGNSPQSFRAIEAALREFRPMKLGDFLGDSLGLTKQPAIECK